VRFQDRELAAIIVVHTIAQRWANGERPDYEQGMIDLALMLLDGTPGCAEEDKAMRDAIAAAVEAIKLEREQQAQLARALGAWLN
jgi:hypothetical protein